MAEGYKQVFWGLFLTIFHINIGSLRILPCCVALLIVVSGVRRLEEHHSDGFTRAARIFGIAAAVADAADIALSIAGGGLAARLLTTVQSGVYLACAAALGFCILMGGAAALSKAQAFGREERADFFRRRAGLLLIISTGSAVLLFCGLAVNGDSLMTAGAVVWIVAQIWTMALVHSLDQAFSQPDGSAPEGEDKNG